MSSSLLSFLSNIAKPASSARALPAISAANAVRKTDLQEEQLALAAQQQQFAQQQAVVKSITGALQQSADNQFRERQQTGIEDRYQQTFEANEAQRRVSNELAFAREDRQVSQFNQTMANSARTQNRLDAQLGMQQTEFKNKQADRANQNALIQSIFSGGDTGGGLSLGGDTSASSVEFGPQTAQAELTAVTNEKSKISNVLSLPGIPSAARFGLMQKRTNLAQESARLTPFAKAEIETAETAATRNQNVNEIASFQGNLNSLLADKVAAGQMTESEKEMALLDAGSGSLPTIKAVGPEAAARIQTQSATELIVKNRTEGVGGGETRFHYRNGIAEAKKMAMAKRLSDDPTVFLEGAQKTLVDKYMAQKPLSESEIDKIAANMVKDTTQVFRVKGSDSPLAVYKDKNGKIHASNEDGESLGIFDQ